MATTMTILEAEDPAREARLLILAHHPHLREAKIRWLFVDKRVKCVPKLLNPLERYLESGRSRLAAAGAEFLVLLSLDDWNVLDDGARAATVDHRLTHMARIRDPETDETAWAIRLHEVEEFVDVVRRHGLYRPELREMVAAARQLPLPVPEAALGLAELAGRDGIKAVTLSASVDGRPIGEPVTITAETGRRLREVVDPVTSG